MYTYIFIHIHTYIHIPYTCIVAYIYMYYVHSWSIKVLAEFLFSSAISLRFWLIKCGSLLICNIIFYFFFLKQGLIPRAKLLLTIGGTFFFGLWPLILITVASFATLYLVSCTSILVILFFNALNSSLNGLSTNIMLPCIKKCNGDYYLRSMDRDTDTCN